MTDLQELMALSAEEERLRAIGGGEWAEAFRAYTDAARRFIRSPAFAEMARNDARYRWLRDRFETYSTNGRTSAGYQLWDKFQIPEDAKGDWDAKFDAAIDAAASGGG